jgi:hypothetical protein
MLDLLIAAALAQPAAPAAPDPCFAVPVPAQPATCPRWRSTSQSTEHQTFTDPGSLRRNGNTFEVLSWIVFAADREGARSVLLRHRHDCGRRTATVLDVLIYDARGAQLAQFPPTGAEAEPAAIVTGSPGAAEHAEFCPR